MLEKHKPVVVFETHSLYNDWSNGLENSDSVKFMTDLGYDVYAVREFHQNIDTGICLLNYYPPTEPIAKYHHIMDLICWPFLQKI